MENSSRQKVSNQISFFDHLLNLMYLVKTDILGFLANLNFFVVATSDKLVKQIFPSMNVKNIERGKGTS